MDRKDFDPSYGADLRSAVRWRSEQPSDEYDPNTPFHRYFVLNPVALLGIALVLAVVGLFFVFR